MHKVQPSISPTPDRINRYVSTQQRARSPAPKVNDTSRAPTDSSLTISTVLPSFPRPYLVESSSGMTPWVVPGSLVKSNDYQTSSDATSCGSSITQAPSLSTSQHPPITWRSTPPVAPGASKHTAAPIQFKATYMASRSAFHAPLPSCIATTM